MTKRLDREQIELEQRAVDAAARRDPEALREALHDLGFVKNPSKLDAERLMEHVMVVGGWYMEDREIQLTPERVMKVIESTSDPRSEYYDLMRRESIPAEELMGRRMETGVLAVLAQLRATRNWHRISREWIYGDPPAGELGELEAAYFEERGERRVPGLAEPSLGLGPLGRVRSPREQPAAHEEERDQEAEHGGDRHEPEAGLDPGGERLAHDRRDRGLDRGAKLL